MVQVLPSQAPMQAAQLLGFGLCHVQALSRTKHSVSLGPRGRSKGGERLRPQGGVHQADVRLNMRDLARRWEKNTQVCEWRRIGEGYWPRESQVLEHSLWLCCG